MALESDYCRIEIRGRASPARGSPGLESDYCRIEMRHHGSERSANWKLESDYCRIEIEELRLHVPAHEPVRIGLL